jgi:hypothetical protein
VDLDRGSSGYNYCNNNPMTLIDPTGKDSTDDSWLKGAPNQDANESSYPDIDPVNLVKGELSQWKQTTKKIIEKGAETSDDVTDLSNAVIITAFGYTIITDGTSGIVIPFAIGVGRSAEAASLALKTIDWLAFDGSGKAVGNQALVLGADFILTSTFKKLSEGIVIKNSPQILGPLYRSAISGRFVTNVWGNFLTKTIPAVKDVTTVFILEYINNNLNK